MNYCHFWTELGFEARAASWVVYICVGLAGFGTVQVEPVYQRWEAVVQRSSVFSICESDTCAAMVPGCHSL